MGSELVGNSPDMAGGRQPNRVSAPCCYTTYTEQFLKVFPFYLSIGMTYNQFWNEDCLLAKFYKKAFNLKQKRKNEELWLQGMYVYEALCDVSPVLNAFAKKGTKPRKYLAEPLPLNAKENEERKLRDDKKHIQNLKDRLIGMSKNKK